jgi:hypothetical protein
MKRAQSGPFLFQQQKLFNWKKKPLLTRHIYPLLTPPVSYRSAITNTVKYLDISGR